MALQPYTKPHFDSTAVIAHLQARGLRIVNHASAARAIEEIGYERLRIYFLSRRDLTQLQKPFRTDITFDDILSIYNFDEALRMHCFKACGRVEVIFRGSVSEALSRLYGSHPYFDPSAYKNDVNHRAAIKSLSDLYYKKLSSDDRAQHYFRKYNPPMLPPIWILKEIMTFGFTNIFSETLSNAIRKDIAKRLKLPNIDVMTSWIKSLIDLRNACAHHDRIFNRVFQKQPSILKKDKIPTAKVTNKVYSLLECIQHIVQAHDPAYDVLAEVKALVNSTPAIQPHEIGL